MWQSCSELWVVKRLVILLQSILMCILYCIRQGLDYVELDPVTNGPLTISQMDIDVQLVHQFSKIPGHKIKARID